MSLVSKVLARSGAAVSKAAPTMTAMNRDMSTKPQRTISPHVTIYNFPAPALSSITHRATGVALSTGTRTRLISII